MENNNYFLGDDLAYDAWVSKYQHNKETLDEFFGRIASEFARLDNFKKNSEQLTDYAWKSLSEYGRERLSNKDRYESFLDLFKDFKYIIPGGSVLAGIGSGKPVSLSNCFVTKTGDSIEQIFDTAREMSEIYKRRGGNGTDLSNLRPAGAFVNNAAKTTGGVVPFMELYSQVTNTIGQDGRRGALMLSIDIKHPDSPEFIKIKQDLTKVTGANVSVRISKDFMDAVENDRDYILRWPCEKDLSIFSEEYLNVNYNELTYIEDHTDNSIIYIKKVRAKELWDSIIHCAWSSAEPGILFWDNIIENDPASVYDKFRAVSTNPCVTPETTLLTKEGFKSIVTLLNQEIEIWNGKEWTLVTPFQTSDNEQVFKVVFSDGTDLTCTNYHEFILKDGIRKQLKDCKIGDKLSKFVYPLIEFSDSYGVDKNAYTQGFFAGDGTISIEKGRDTRYFIDLYGEKIDLIPYLNVKEYGTLDLVNNKIRTIIVNQMSPLKTFVPTQVCKETRLAWLAGLLDSDGTLNDSGGSLAITSINKEFLTNVKSMLITLGIRSTIGIIKEEQQKEIKGEIYACQTCYRLVISAYYVKQLIELGLITHRIPLIANPNRDASRFIQIESIELIGNSDVYCVTDNKNHSALFNHVMTAQCGEIPLSPYDSCRLIASNLYSLVQSPFTPLAKINKDLAYRVFYEAQIIADILVDLEIEAINRIISISQNKEKEFWEKVNEIGKAGRRTGTGITALGDMMAALNLNYNSPIIGELMKLKMKAELDATIDLAILNSPFPDYDGNKEYSNNNEELDEVNYIGNNKFFNFLMQEFPSEWQRMRIFGRRNISWSTINFGGLT